MAYLLACVQQVRRNLRGNTEIEQLASYGHRDDLAGLGACHQPW